jgi:hypothetical protein
MHEAQKRFDVTNQSLPVMSIAGLDSGKSQHRVHTADSGASAAPEYVSPSRVQAQSLAGLSENATPAERAQYLKQSENLAPVNVADLIGKDSRVITIGDQHRMNGIKDFTAENMKAFKDAGVKAIGMELLPRSTQPLLDEYASLKSNPASDPAAVTKLHDKVMRHTLRELFKTAQQRATG